MSLHLVESPQQEQLAEALVRQLAGSTSAQDCLQTSTVIVQNAGLGRWLRLWHARHCGISAGVKMPFAQSYIAKEMEGLGGYERWQELSPQVLRWQIFTFLQSRGFEVWADAGPLAGYLSGDQGTLEGRCWALSMRLADLFDRYAVHRPEWIEAWLSRSLKESALPHWNWQAQLFRAVVEQMGLTPEAIQKRLIGPALHSYLNTSDIPDDGRRDPVYVFGISSLPPLFLRFFERLARSREVYLYHLIPSNGYLGDLPQQYRTSLLAQLDAGELDMDQMDLLENGLLIANGQSAARFQSLLLSLNFPTGEMPQLAQGPAESDLQQLQQAVRLNEPYCDFGADGSLSIHQCHSRLREVQVLQQQLLAQFAADPKLLPKDIMVLVPEISEYTDAIQSVFGMGTRLDADADPVKIPYCIADQESSGDANCWRFFSALLGLLKGRQLFSEVMALLDFDPIGQRLSLDREVLKELSMLLQSVGVRWGIDGASREAKGLPEYDAYSWDYGFQQLYDGLIYGEWTPSDRASQVTSNQLLEALGSLTQLLRPIFALAVCSKERHSFKEWSESLLGVLREGLGDGHESGEWMRLLAVAIGELQQHATDTEIALDTYCKMLEEGDHSNSGPSGMLRRGVTFCRLQPARHIPAKVVCMLGLDEGSYPRQEKSLEFDLIDLHRRSAKVLKGTELRYQESHYLGDTHIRDEDRQLFLDCLLNARGRLYLSYVGQSDQNNEDLPPSLLVSELKQFLERFPCGGEDAAKERKELLSKVIVRHPLQDWSLENFKQPLPKAGEPPVPVQFNAQIANLQRSDVAKPPFFESEGDDVSDSDTVVTLSPRQLRKFLVDPPAAYLKKQFRVDLDPLRWEKNPEDMESFGASALEKWQLREDLLEHWLLAKQSGQGMDEFAEHYRRQLELELKLPLGSAGEQCWKAELSPIVDRLREFDSEDLQKTSYEFTQGAVRFQQDSWQLGDGRRVIFLNGDLDLVNKPKYYIDAFIGHVGSEAGSLIVNLKDPDALREWPGFNQLAAAQSEESLDAGFAANWLAKVLDLWKQGQARVLTFSPVIAARYWAVLAEREDPSGAPQLDWQSALTKAYELGWQDKSGRGHSDADTSDAQKLCFDGDSPAAPDAPEERRLAFLQNAEAIMKPLYDWMAALTPQKSAKKKGKK